MADTVSKARRSEIMAAVRAKNTKPELQLRRLIHAMGFRYRLHLKNLPGTPDLVFPSRKKVIFLHGCFWHRHAACPAARIPKTREEFWTKKLDDNARRDARIELELKESGWDSLVVWECDLRKPDDVCLRVARFLGRSDPNA